MFHFTVGKWSTKSIFMSLKLSKLCINFDQCIYGCDLKTVIKIVDTVVLNLDNEHQIY